VGIPAPNGVAAPGLPPSGDQANAYLAGAFTAVGPSQPFAFRGPMNLVLWVSINTALTTTKGSLNCSVASATGLAIGDAINSVNVPPGTTLATLSGTNGTLALPPVNFSGNVSTSAAAISNVALPSTGFYTSLAQLIGATVVSPYLPANTTVLGKNGTSLELSAVPTSAPTNNYPVPSFQFFPTANAIVASGADPKAVFTGGAITFSGTLQLERSFDGGSTFIVCNIGTSGTLAQWTGTTVGPIQLTFGEPEKEVLYRFNCTVLTSVLGGGTLNYRISQTGGAAESLAIGPLTSG
jgi:hypothetical protein